MSNYDKILQGILDVGEEMIVAGAEVSRVEDSIERMCVAYGATPGRVNVFIITSNIQVTVEVPDGSIITQIRRIMRNDVNFDRLDYLNDLCRRICATTPEPVALQEQLSEVLNRKKQPRMLSYLGAVLAAGGFAVFFGGTWLDFLGASTVGIVIVLFGGFLSLREENQLIYNFVVSLVAGILSPLLVELGIGSNPDKIMIGAIMLLIPGIAMTNALRDMLMGDIASGMLRLVDSIIVAASIACGFALSIILFGGVL